MFYVIQYVALNNMNVSDSVHMIQMMYIYNYITITFYTTVHVHNDAMPYVDFVIVTIG